MIIHILDLFGVAVFAVTGALAAGLKRMDVFGMVVVAIVTAIGGGTIRDVILGVPVVWISSPVYVLVATAAALATFAVPRVVRRVEPMLYVFDALGLAVFTVIGCQKAISVGVSYIIVVVMGGITGVAGGVIRDILCGEIPLVLRKEIYAIASLLGGVTLVVLFDYGVARGPAVLMAAAVTLVVRLVAIHYGLSLPVADMDESEQLIDTGGDIGGSAEEK